MQKLVIRSISWILRYCASTRIVTVWRSRDPCCGASAPKACDVDLRPTLGWPRLMKWRATRCCRLCTERSKVARRDCAAKGEGLCALDTRGQASEDPRGLPDWWGRTDGGLTGAPRVASGDSAVHGGCGGGVVWHGSRMHEIAATVPAPADFPDPCVRCRQGPLGLEIKP